MNARGVLACALLALCALHVAWFQPDVVAVSVFALPPLLLAAALPLPRMHAAFWAGVLALLWFSHGIMAAWSRPAERGMAWLEVALALIVVVAGNWAALRARFGRARVAGLGGSAPTHDDPRAPPVEASEAPDPQERARPGR